MGKKAEIRIQNRSSFALELSITETTRVKNDGLASIQGTIPRNGCLPQEGYSTIEGEPRLRVHKDGKLNLLARRKDEEGDGPHRSNCTWITGNGGLDAIHRRTFTVTRAWY